MKSAFAETFRIVTQAEADAEQDEKKRINRETRERNQRIESAVESYITNLELRASLVLEPETCECGGGSGCPLSHPTPTVSSEKTLSQKVGDILQYTRAKSGKLPHYGAMVRQISKQLGVTLQEAADALSEHVNDDDDSQPA